MEYEECSDEKKVLIYENTEEEELRIDRKGVVKALCKRLTLTWAGKEPRSREESYTGNESHCKGTGTRRKGTKH